MQAPSIAALHQHFEKVNSNPIKPLRDFLERISLVPVQQHRLKPLVWLSVSGLSYTQYSLSYSRRNLLVGKSSLNDAALWLLDIAS